MKEIQVSGKRFWVDLDFSLDEICKDIFGYLGVEGWRSWSGGRENLTAAQVKQRRVITLKVRKQLTNYKSYKKRNPAPAKSKKGTPGTPPKIASALVAWDMKQGGKTYRQVIEAVWPDEASRLRKQGKRLRDAGSRSALLQRAREHVKYADGLIKRVFSR